MSFFIRRIEQLLRIYSLIFYRKIIYRYGKNEEGGAYIMSSSRVWKLFKTKLGWRRVSIKCKKGKSLGDKCFLFLFFISSNYDTAPSRNRLYVLHKGEREVVPSMMKNGIHVYLFFFLFYSIEEFFITLSIKLKSSSIVRVLILTRRTIE